MKIDTSWESSKRSLKGLTAFIFVLTFFYWLGAEGIFGLMCAILAWYLVYKYTGERKGESE